MNCIKCGKDSVVEHGANANRWACISCWHSWPKEVGAKKIDRRNFPQILMEKVAQKKRELSNIEKRERTDRWHDFSQEKIEIKAGIKALLWCEKAYNQFAQADMNDFMTVK